MCPPPADYEELINEQLVENAGQVKLDEAQRWGKGIIQDAKRTVGTWWVKEMTNPNLKTVAVTLLLFISVISPTLAFGAVYSKVTENHIGAIENILSTAWVGIAYALIGGMPMCVAGSTGPILAVSSAIYSISNSIGVPYLTFHAWVSVWVLGYILIATFFDFTRYVRLATRFTDDIFAFIIVMIFIMDAIGDPFSYSGLLRYFDDTNPFHDEFIDDETYDQTTTALLSVLLGIGTTWLIFFFRGFKGSSFFCSDLTREMIYDFAVSASVLTWCLLYNFGFDHIQIEKLEVPSTIEPTYACCDSSCTTYWPTECPEQEEPSGTRSWFINLGDLNGVTWAPIAAAGPAIFAFILLYLDNGITWHLISNKNHKLQHGEAYNYDLLLNGIFNCINGMLGLPWVVATTVPCIIHLHGLATKDDKGNIVSVQETRLTNLSAHGLMMSCLAFLSVLQLIPLPVLYGVFLFMGLSSLPGLQFWGRILMFFMQPSKYPETNATKYMKQSRIHKYTCFQLLFFGGVFLVQNIKAISIAFPLMTLLCIPGRLFILPKFFKGWELVLLDGEDDQIEEWITAKENATNTMGTERTSVGFVKEMSTGSLSVDDDTPKEDLEIADDDPEENLDAVLDAV